ncbi:MAG: ABC transporter ATP-binding protein [Deltaproteobacteria bacterium]|jgi:nickel transport system ATP-binding protein|nr:ABC transporter ATP-binding protein [Deltaproteobacteria bacterium]
MSAFLEIKDLTIRAKGDGRVLVDNLSLSLEKSRKLAILGESGSGKTMTSLSVLNILPSSVDKVTGDIIIDGKDTSTFTDDDWRQLRNSIVSMVLQNPISAFDPVITIRSHFKETMGSHGLDTSNEALTENAAAHLKEAGFEDPIPVLSLYPFQMSGGMLQRVMMALALITQPQLLIADEATTDLDVVTQAQVLELIADRVESRHMSLLLITHDLSVAAKLADDVMVMRQGKVLETGTIQHIFENPTDDYTKELLKAHTELYNQRFVKFMNYIEEKEPCPK